MNALSFTPSKVTVNMNPVDLSATDVDTKSGVRSIQWMVRTEDGLVGPVSYELVERGLNLGKVPETAEIAPEGSDAWRPVRDVVKDQDEEPELEPAEVVVIVAAPVVPVGQPEVEWPQSFAPQPVAPIAAPPAQQHVPVQPIQQQAYPTPQPQQAWPEQMPSFQGEEPIAIPTNSMSPALIAFGATLGVSAVIGIAVAVIQAL